MNVETFLAEFGHLADAPNGVQKLHELILQLAVMGKLVPQDPTDESADVMLAKIQSEKKRLGDSGELKADKKAWVNSSANPPHDIPKLWRWVRIQDLFEISRGSSPRPAGDPRFFGGPIPWITVGEVTKDSEKYLTKTSTGLTEEGANRSRFIDPDDLLLTNSGATLGVPKINKIRGCMNDGVAVLRQFHSFNINDFGYLYLSSQTPAFRNVNQGMGQPNLNTPIIAGWHFPLPPLAEQQRIVAKVDELMALCDELAAKQTRRQTVRVEATTAALSRLTTATTPAALSTAWTRVADHFDDLFTTPQTIPQLRQSILQLAVMGKLVPQDAESESAEILLRKISQQFVKVSTVQNGEVATEDFAAYQLPRSWVWTTFGCVVRSIESGRSPQCEARRKEVGEWGVLKVSAVSWGRFQPSENKALPVGMQISEEYEVKKGDFLISRANTAELVAKSVVVESTEPKLLLSDKILRVVFHTGIEKRFANLVNNSPLARAYYAQVATGTSESMRNVSREQIRSLPFPLAPQAVQRRIVAKVDELMAICDSLETKLATEETTAERLTAAMVQAVLNGNRA